MLAANAASIWALIWALISAASVVSGTQVSPSGVRRRTSTAQGQGFQTRP
jgi:hypothetical protein